ncbi:hypothetical protein FVEN_g6432 [Fusarium venenatum]|nr:hypothetical protein FVEN_g6432 [Fusarium venenatum]
MTDAPEEPKQPRGPEQSVLVPLKLDAFVFNSLVCDGIPPKAPATPNSHHEPTAAKIAPIEQPNYTFLRLDSTLIQPDIQNPVDLYNSWPSSSNSRHTNLGTNNTYPQRIGVYLHWTLPRFFRSGLELPKQDKKLKPRGKSAFEGGDKPKPSPSKDYTSSVFPSVPNRWLVIRHIPDKGTIVPSDAEVPEFSGWVIESDRRWELKNLGMEVDLQTDVSPFIAAGDEGNKDEDKKDNTVSKQAEVFIGSKTPLESWVEQYQPKSDKTIPGGTADDKSQAKFLPHFSLLTSSNQLFADYQPHNPNVFSMCDNFEYEKGKFLEKATAHYYVVGWYSEPKNDLMFGPLLAKNPDGSKRSRNEKLEALKSKIKLENSEGKQLKDDQVATMFSFWLDDKTQTRMVCHGSMYEVKWDSKNKPDKVPADMFCTQLNTTLPLAVGTTPLDAMTTYARAHTCLPSKNTDDKEVTVPQLEKWITELERHLLSRDDGIETQNQASDMLYNWNFARSDGGQNWNAAGMDQKAESPNRPGGTPLDLVDKLRDLNIQQKFLDAIQRAMSRVRRDMFAVWWNCVTDDTADELFADKAQTLKTKFDALEVKKTACEAAIKELVDEKKMQKGALPTFYQQRDPTLLVGGVSSGWQYDYLDDLLVRLDEQVIVTTKKPEKDNTVTSPWDDFEKSFGGKFPDTVKSSIARLFAEFQALDPAHKALKEEPERKTTSPPLFHDQYSAQNPRLEVQISTDGEKENLWRDRWNNTQPWFPLFLEWEVEYHHIPFETWDLAKTTSRSSNMPQLRYGIPSDKIVREKEPPKGKKLPVDEEPDKQRIQGRVLILPQPSFSLGAKIEQLFAGTPQPILDHSDDYLSPENRALLQKELYKLAFLSAPLAGLSAHLTTVLQGNHIKPNMRNAETNKLDPIKEALRPKAGLDDKKMQIIDIETDSTPFGTSMRSPVGPKNTLFKPVTHGQFRFTKLNIIDKFGQAIHAITPSAEILPEPILPCISEWYAPQLIGKTEAPNVVAPRDLEAARFDGAKDDPQECPPKNQQKCEFIQVPPMINQYSRLNASFVVRVSSDKEKEKKPELQADPEPVPLKPYAWRPASEWENPVWGWVLINYANQGIQIFTQDGSFYREVRLGGPKGAQSTPAWLPFRPPKPDEACKNMTPEMAQLGLLVARLGNVDFLRAFWEMIMKATLNLQPAPEAYAGFTNAALVGRPLALCQAGWSVELAVDALTSQARGENPIPRKLLGKSREAHKIEDDDSDEENNNPGQYAFKVKIGDKQKGFDGLVGVLRCDKYADLKTQKGLGLKLDTVYSDYVDQGDAFQKDEGGKDVISPMSPLVLRPFYLSPNSVSGGKEYEEECNKKLSVRTILIDPFSPIHAYSGILPVRELILPPWTWQAALSKMAAFFHAGPIVLTKDVPSEFKEERELSSDDPNISVPDVIPGEGPVRLPELGNGGWAWLQPYYGNNGESFDAQVGEKDAPERYMILPTAPEDQGARFEEGPYTMVEGYLLKVNENEKSGKKKP